MILFIFRRALGPQTLSSESPLGLSPLFNLWAAYSVLVLTNSALRLTLLGQPSQVFWLLGFPGWFAQQGRECLLLSVCFLCEAQACRTAVERLKHEFVSRAADRELRSCLWRQCCAASWHQLLCWVEQTSASWQSLLHPRKEAEAKYRKVMKSLINSIWIPAPFPWHSFLIIVAWISPLLKVFWVSQQKNNLSF